MTSMIPTLPGRDRKVRHSRQALATSKFKMFEKCEKQLYRYFVDTEGNVKLHAVAPGDGFQQCTRAHCQISSQLANIAFVRAKLNYFTIK